MNVHKLNFDTSGNVEDITFVLATKNGDKISNITNVTDIVTKHAMNSYSEFSFNAHKELNRNTLRCWNDIKDFKLMWIPEWDMWFETYVEIDEENEDIKKVTGKSLGEAELSQIMLYNIEINTETDISRDDYKIPTTFYNPDHPEASLVNRLTEKAPHYRFAHIDISLMNIQRTFTFDKKSIYDALKEVAEELNCLFVFGCGSDANGKPERTISVYDLEANCKDCGHRDTFVDKCPKCGSTNVTNGYGEYTNVFISRDNLVEEVTYTTDVDSVKNCFKLTAGDDLMTAAVRSCNPNGSDYIYYFSDAVRSDMSEQLQEKLSAYDKLYEEYQKTHKFYIDSSFVNNYNAIVAKYIKYDDSLKKIESPVTGYPKLMQTYFDTIDMVQFLKNKLMPNITKPDNSAKSQGEYLMENLPSSAATTSLKNLSVSTANNIMISLAQSIVKGSFKITVTETTLSNDVWRGKFNLKSYSDEDDTYTSSPVSIGINENYEEYVRQRIEKILNKSDDNYYDIVGLFKQDLTVFKSELKKYCLDSLNTFQKCCQSCIDIMVQQGVASDSSTATTSNAINAKAIYDSLYVPYYNKLNAIQDEILVREDEVYTVEGKYNNQNELIQDGVQIEIERIIGDVQDTLNFQKFIGDELNKEFCAFLRMDEYSNDNYISDGLDNTELFQNAFDFINVATKELYKSATLQHSITGTLKNFLRMREFAPIVNSFKNGNWITIQIDDEIYQLRIIEYTIDFASSQNIDVTFSDVISAKDIASDIKSILDQASNMATSYGSIVRQSDMNSNFSKKMSDMILKGLDMTNTKIVSSADNQDITWDEHGLLCREFNDILNDYNPCQLKIINHGLYITNDGWKTAKAGVGQFYYFDPKDKVYKEGYGIIADTLVGNLILSSQVGIYNEEKSIEMDKNGIIVTTNTYNKNVFTIKKEITDDEGNITYERQLYIDDNGNIVLGGGASISWDNVIGTDKDGKSNSMSKLFETLNDTLNEKYNYLLNQDDKKAETWYQSGDPSVDWTTDELKARHKGDLWYNTNDQKTYIFNGNSWELTKTTPPDEVFDKIDGKAQIFVSQPKPPYNVGDLWFDSKTSDIMTCIKKRDSGDYVASDWEKRNKYTDNSELTNFVENIYTKNIKDLQNQVDGQIETFYYDYEPTLLNYPASEWTSTTEREKHIGDLFYWKTKGYAYRFLLDGATWKWQLVQDTDITKAMETAEKAKDTADGKRRVFVTEPEPPYDIGDLWTQGTSGDLMRCKISRSIGSFDSADWEKATKYTDDSSLISFIKGEYAETLETVKGQIDEKADTWYQETDPSTAWKTADDKKKHIGDLWYDTKNQKTYIYGAKGWEETKTNPPDSVFDKIDGKAQIFVAQPKPPYAVGDLWFNSKTSDIMTCVKARTTGNFDSTDWEKRNKYTDDSSLTDFINNTYTTDIGNIQDQIDGKIETFRQETDPSTAWKTADDKKKHIGDLWYDTATNETFMYNGAGWSPVAGTVPDEVWGKIDSKCQIFTAQPKPPYNKGDLWFVGSSGDILTCTTVRKDGESYVETDWTKQNKYTDDTTANTIKNGILKSTYIDSQWVIAPNIKGGQLLISNKSGTISAQITSEGKLIAKEGEFSGKIVATSGEIGGFNIDNYSLWSGQNVLGGSGVYISPKYGISCNSSFKVTASGSLTATDADITGDITATSIYAQDAYYIYNGTQTQNAKVIWCNTTQYEWNPSKDVIDFAIGTKDKAYLDFLTYTLNGHVSREASLCTVSTTSDGAIVRCSSTDGISKVCFLAQTSGVSNVAAVQLRASATNGCCFMPGEFDDRSYDGKINLGISTNKWKQVYTKDLYVDTIHFTQNNSSMSTASSGGVSGNYIPMAGTSKDSNDYVKSPVTGTVHMKNNNGWDLLNTDGYEVTGIYCNKSNQVIIGDNPYKTIVRGNGIQLGNNDTIINIPYLKNYTSASKYLVADDSGNIGWRSVTQGKTYNLANASTYGVMCLYNSTGSYTDGTMTQKAITESINNAGGGGSSYYAGKGLYLSGSTFNIGYNSRYSADFYEGSNSNHYAFCPTLANNAGDAYRLYLGGNGGSTHPWYKVVTRDGMQQLSDGRFKIDKCILNDDFYDMYMSLKPTKYKVLHDEDSGIHFGFVAQEVEESLKTVGLDASNCSIVSCDESQSYEGGYVYGLSYNEFIPFNTYMTQKAHHRIDELENEIKKLKQIINSLQGVA